VVEDMHMDGVPAHPSGCAGTLVATLVFLKDGGGKDFEPDFSREKMATLIVPY
jgi:hypothetical protein